MTNVALTQVSPWPHRLAVALALATFPLIWVGGLVTTYDAGMAVPDWPTTFGHNMFLYPWQWWVSGPWDLFIEHGHRLLGSLAGFLTLLLAASVWLTERRIWFKRLSLAAIGLIVLQGLIGGLRVRLDERLVALVHGCVGPAFFALAAAMAVCSSRRWMEANVASKPAVRIPLSAAWWLAGLAYLQLTIGAVLRHVPVMAPPEVFRTALIFHLIVAAAVAGQALHVAWTTLRGGQSLAWLRGMGLLAAALVVGQIALGIAAYVAKYAWPAWADSFAFAASHVTAEKSLSQSLITTAHVANGSLILATTVVLAVRATRLHYLAAATGLGSLVTFTSSLRAAV